jgi:hypothetical protein
MRVNMYKRHTVPETAAINQTIVRGLHTFDYHSDYQLWFAYAWELSGYCYSDAHMPVQQQVPIVLKLDSRDPSSIFYLWRVSNIWMCPTTLLSKPPAFIHCVDTRDSLYMWVVTPSRIVNKTGDRFYEVINSQSKTNRSYSHSCLQKAGLRSKRKYKPSRRSWKYTDDQTLRTGKGTVSEDTKKL